MRGKTTWIFAGALSSLTAAGLTTAACGGSVTASSDGGREAARGRETGPGYDAPSQDTATDAVTMRDTSPGNDASDAAESGPTDAPPPPPADGSILPPPPPADAALPTTTPTNFAIHKLYLGDTAFGGKPGGDATAWATMGYNIDGKITTASSKNVCTLHGGGGSFGLNAQVDGMGGIDNSFGENFYDGILLAIDPTVSATIDTDLAAGKTTEMIDVTGLSSSATQTATGLSAQAFGGGTFAGTPTWTTADDWPVLSTTILGTTPPFTAKQTFPGAYVVSGTWVSGPPGDITLPLFVSGVAFPLTIHQAVITFQHTTPTHAAGGIISGVLDTTELLTEITTIAGTLSPSLCMGTALDPILQQIKDSQDILSDGTNPMGVSCNAISIGLGFTADEIAQPTMAVTVCPKANPCDPDAGVPSCDGG